MIFWEVVKYATALLTKLNTAEFFIDAFTEWVSFLTYAFKLISSAIDKLCSFWIVIADCANTFLNLDACQSHHIISTTVSESPYNKYDSMTL